MRQHQRSDNTSEATTLAERQNQRSDKTIEASCTGTIDHSTWKPDASTSVEFSAFPKTINEGDLLSYECSFALPEKIHHVENCEVVVILLDKDGRFLNADNAKVLDEQTGISLPSSVQHPESTVYYDLRGRRVTRPSHGIYIYNGRKVIF